MGAACAADRPLRRPRHRVFAADPRSRRCSLLVGAANRDHRRFPPDGDTFDIHREQHSHMTFGAGTHFCMGNALARLEGRIALEEILKRFPKWEVDLAQYGEIGDRSGPRLGRDAHLHSLKPDAFPILQ